jgi:hypothetical protein
MLLERREPAMPMNASAISVQRNEEAREAWFRYTTARMGGKQRGKANKTSENQ